MSSKCQRHEDRAWLCSLDDTFVVKYRSFQAEGKPAKPTNALWLSSLKWLRSVQHYLSQLSFPEGSYEIVSCCCVVWDSDGNVSWGRRGTNIFIMWLKREWDCTYSWLILGNPDVNFNLHKEKWLNMEFWTTCSVISLVCRMTQYFAYLTQLNYVEVVCILQF